MSIINFEGYNKGPRVSVLDRANPVIHENMNTLETMLADRKTTRFSDEVNQLVDQVNKLIQYDMPNVGEWETATTRLVFLLKREGEEGHIGVSDKIKELQKISEEFLVSNTSVALMEGYYSTIISKGSKLFINLLQVLNVLSIFLLAFFLQSFQDSIFSVLLILGGVGGVDALIIVGVKRRGLNRRIKTLEDVEKLHDDTGAIFMAESLSLLNNPLIPIPLYLLIKRIATEFNDVNESKDIINLTSYLNAPEKAKNQVSSISQYVIPTEYSFKFNELINGENLSNEDTNELVKHLDYFANGLGLMTKK